MSYSLVLFVAGKIIKLNSTLYQNKRKFNQRMRMLSTIDTTRSVRNLLNSIFMAKLRQRRERIFGWYNNVLASASIYLHNIHLKAVQHRRLGRRRRCWVFFSFLFSMLAKQLMERKNLFPFFACISFSPPSLPSMFCTLKCLNT